MAMPDKTTNRTTYTVAQLLAAHRNFATPEGVENHHAIYSPAALIPELFGPEPPYNSIVAVAPRVKRPLSDLTDKPRTLQNTRSRDIAPRSKPTPTRPNRVEEEVPPARPWAGNVLEEAFTSPPGERFGSIDNWQELRRPTLRQQTQASRFSGNDAAQHQDWRSARNTGSTPHTAESWERLGQKLRQTGFKPGSDLSPATDTNKRADICTDNAAQKERALTEVTALLKARYPEELTEELINRLLRGELAPRPAAPMAAPMALQEPVSPPLVCKQPPTSFQQLLQQTSGAASAAQMAEPTMLEAASSRLSLNDKIVRWSDMRPLFMVQIPKVAISVAKELAAARASAARSSSRDQVRSVYELYETRVARLYDELKKIRQVTLPEPLQAALNITEETSLALWPTFRELFMQTEHMLHQLQQWETASAMPQTLLNPSPVQHQLPLHHPQPPIQHQQPPIQHQPPPIQHQPTIRPIRPGVPPQQQRVESPVLVNKTSGVWKHNPLSGPVLASQQQPQQQQPKTAIGFDGRGASPIVQKTPLGGSAMSQQQQQQLRMYSNLEWEYLDPNRNVQGPFPSQRMYDWWRRDFFPSDLPIRQSGRKKFIPLSTLYPPELHAQYSPFRDPWPVTLKDETPAEDDLPPPQQRAPTLTQQTRPLVVPHQEITRDNLHTREELPPEDASDSHQSLFASPPGSPRSPPRAQTIPQKQRPQVSATRNAQRDKEEITQTSPAGPAGVVYRPAPPSTSSHESHSQSQSHSHHQPVWARKTTLEDAAAFERAAAVSESEGLGPSLAESRNDIARANASGEAQDGSKTSRKKVKGKKQPLSELLTAQNEQAAAVRSAWASQRAAVPQAVMRTGSEDDGLPSGGRPMTPSGVPISTAPISSPSNLIPSAERKYVGDANPLDEAQMSDVAQLCERHNISLDKDFIGLLATMGSVQEMSSFLVDNLGSTAVQVDPFVQDFWDLIKNPFKPVVKGLVATALTSSRGGKKKSAKQRR